MSATERKAKSTLSSAEIIGSNHDILNEIFLRTPAKPLLKFKCVSKQWLSLISDPEFCLSHTRRRHSLNPTPNALLLNNFYTPTPEFQVVPLKDSTEVPFLDYLNVPRVMIHVSCNGLLLCSSSYLCKAGDYPCKRLNRLTGEWVPSPFLDDGEDYCSFVVNADDRGYRFFICNPTTRQFKRLILPRYASKGSGAYGAYLNLAFDPLKSPYYKVICLELYDWNMNTYVIDVYSSETDSWTETRIILELPCSELRRPGVFCNGAIHWRSHATALSYFDVGIGTLNTMPLPPMLFVDGHMSEILYFGECCGHLHVIGGNEHLKFPLQFDVFEMASDYSGWSVRYHVDISPTLSSHQGERFGAFSVLSVIQAEEEGESMIVLFLDGGVAVSYNPCDGSSNKLSDLEPRPRGGYYLVDYYGVHTYQYFESLVCV